MPSMTSKGIIILIFNNYHITMKKFMILAAASAMFAACGHNASTKHVADAQDSTTANVDSMFYEGLLPAADTYGIRYRLALSSDSTAGFSLEEAYMKSETETELVSHYQGKAVVKHSKDGAKTYYVLPTEASDSLRFLVINDSTLRMVNDELEEPVGSQLNYDIKLVK